MIRLEDVSKVYAPGTPGEVHALTGISLQVQRGEVFGVIGRSGAGKSTLVRMINLLERPTSGRVIVDGVDLLTLRDRELRAMRRSMGMIFQDFSLMSSLTVYDNVAFALRLERRPDEHRIRTRVTELLELVGLADRRDMYPAQLSGGQRQRVGIARALACEPHILLCDEATSALDPQTTISILDLLLDLKARFSLTIVMITHQMEVIRRCCDRVAVIAGGTILEQGPTLGIFSSPAAELTQSLVRAELGRSLSEALGRMQLQEAYAEGSRAVAELMFLGPQSGDPVISETARECGVQISILAGNIEFIGREPLGLLVVGISGGRAAIDRTMALLGQRVHRARVLGYEHA